MNKFFTKTNRITPVTLYNTGLSIGICSSQFFNTFMKEDVFAVDPITKEHTLLWGDFV
ncbi:MAG: hypothetical protein MJ200_03375 [Mycoplasmoidaceae bacterium]|nr:hypothetical protein [Mycoplasmoidaceae bacterium]